MLIRRNGYSPPVESDRSRAQLAWQHALSELAFVVQEGEQALGRALERMTPAQREEFEQKVRGKLPSDKTRASALINQLELLPTELHGHESRATLKNLLQPLWEKVNALYCAHEKEAETSYAAYSDRAHEPYFSHTWEHVYKSLLAWTKEQDPGIELWETLTFEQSPLRDEQGRPYFNNEHPQILGSTCLEHPLKHLTFARLQHDEAGLELARRSVLETLVLYQGKSVPEAKSLCDQIELKVAEALEQGRTMFDPVMMELGRGYGEAMDHIHRAKRGKYAVRYAKDKDSCPSFPPSESTEPKLAYMAKGYGEAIERAVCKGIELEVLKEQQRRDPKMQDKGFREI